MRYTLQEVLEAQRELARQLWDEDDAIGIEEFQKKSEETMEQKVALGRRMAKFFAYDRTGVPF